MASSRWAEARCWSDPGRICVGIRSDPHVSRLADGAAENGAVRRPDEPPQSSV